MKSEKSIESIRKYSKGIIDFYGQKFLYLKKILDLGFTSDNASLGKSLLDIGSDVTLLRTTNSNLKDITKKFPNVKTISGDFSKQLPFVNQKKFDLTVDIDVVGNIPDYEQHLKDICSSTTHLILECAVLDSPENESKTVEENSDLANYFAVGSKIPSAAAIESELSKNGMNYRIISSDKFNSDEYEYNWINDYDGSISNTYRRIWIVAKRNNASYVHLMNKAFLNAPQVKKIEVIPSPYNPVNQSIPNPPFKEIEVDVLQSIPQQRNLSLFNKQFVIVIPSFNNEKYCEKNILSALEQNYFNYRIIFIDDCSKDNTFELVSNIVNNHRNKDKCLLIKNEKNLGALNNLYNAINSCSDNEIIVTLDGDDWLFHENVLSKLNNYYSEDIWCTYGQYITYPDNTQGVCSQIQPEVIKKSLYRKSKWSSSHLRTFYAKLFKLINIEDLKTNNNFYSMAWDLAIMFPILEMSGNHSKFIDEILYVYNTENPINDNKINRQNQLNLESSIRKKQKYKEIKSLELPSATINCIGRSGRIGNQLFQAAATIAYAKENNLQPVFNWYCTYTKKNMSSFFKNKISNNLSNLKIEERYSEQNYTYNKIPKKNNICLSGYFQSEKYFKEYKDLIRSYFEPNDQVKNKLISKYSNILNKETCALHVRRGDYVNNSYHNVCDTDYYIRAMKKIKELKHIDNFLVFSDDINWCKENLKGLIYIEGNLDIEDIFLMSMCNNFIISNSSFSWWGSWLSTSENKITIAPTKWFGKASKNDDKDVYREDMIKL